MTTTNPAEVAGSWIGPIIGLGFGLAALRMVDRGINGRKISRYVIFIGNRKYRSYKNFDDAKKEVDKLRNRGVLNVSVYAK